MNPIDITVGKNLREKRILHGMSQDELGNAIGISFQQIQKYERGANRISASRMVELSRALKCEINDLFAGIFTEALQSEMRSLDDIRRERKIVENYNHLPTPIQVAVSELVQAMVGEI